MKRWVLLLFALLLLPNLVAICLLSDLQGSLIMKTAYAVFSIFILLIPALILRQRTYFLLQGLFLLLAPLEIAHIILNRMSISEGFLSAVIHTNRQEAIELLSSMKSICVIVLLVWGGYFFIVFTRIKNNYLFTPKTALRIGTLFVLFNLLLYSNMYWRGYKSEVADCIGHANTNFQKKYRKIYPVDLLTVGYQGYNSRKQAELMQKQLQNFSFGASKTNLGGKEIYVVVIGESARYENFSINGYTRPTSPKLERIEGLLSYKQVYATANITEIVIPLLLTRATPQQPDVAYKEKAFTDAFAESGFATAWIANQSAQNPFIQRISEDSDYSYFSLTDFDASTNYDEHLLAQVDSVLQRNQSHNNQLIVLHTLGSHFRYNFRYPEAFKQFTPAMEGTTSYSVLSPDNKELLINTYDNTICYTDHILASLVYRIKQEQGVSALLYVSDHAENLYDDADQLILHGSGRGSEHEMHIPLFVWTSDGYRARYPHKQAELTNNTNRMLTSDNLFHTLLDMADIHYPDEKLTESFASPSFEEDSTRYALTPDKQLVRFLRDKRR